MREMKVNIVFEGIEVNIGTLEVVNGSYVNENEYVGRSKGYIECEVDGNNKSVYWYMVRFEHLDGGDFHALFNAIDEDGMAYEYYTDFPTVDVNREPLTKLNLFPIRNAWKNFEEVSKQYYG